MTVTHVHKDPKALTLTLTAELDATVARAWQLWADPRQLERWWGPPTYPATFIEHDLSPGAIVTYFMTGPTGDRHHGWWRIVSVEPPRRLRFEDGFADASGKPDPALPATIVQVDLSEVERVRTRMTIESKFPSLEAMEQILAMGAEEGMKAALGQIDDLLRSA